MLRKYREYFLQIVHFQLIFFQNIPGGVLSFNLSTFSYQFLLKSRPFLRNTF